MFTRYYSLSLILLLTLFISPAALAQSQGATQGAQSTTPAVTASVSSGGIRFTSPAPVMQMRLEIYNSAGNLIFNSGPRQGTIIDWKLSDALQPMTDGSYLSVLTVKDFQGKTRQRLGTISLQSGQLTLQHAKAEGLSAAQSQALAASRQSQKIEAAETEETITILLEGKERAVTVTAHDGQVGQVTSTSGALTFRTGDIFTQKDKEQMRVTPDGRVGIGTENPEATLDVAGTIRARGGIVLEDGTVVKSAADMGARSNSSAKTGAAVSNTNVLATNSTLSGSGTVNTLTKWTDPATGTIGDSLLAESGSNIVNRGNNIQMTANASPSADTNLLFLNGTDKTMGVLAGNIPAFQAANGPYFALRGNTYAAIGNQRGIFAISAGNVASPSAGEGAIKFLTGADQLRMTIDFAGRIGIGTAAPTQRLEVAGNIKLSGAGNGIIFADGTTMTTASGSGSTPTGNSIVTAINDTATTASINDNRLSGNVARLSGANAWSGANTFMAGLSANGALVTNVGNPVNAADATNKAYVDANFVRFVPGAEQLSVGDANGTAPMINLRGGSTCCSGPGGHTPAWFKVFQNGSFVATGNLGIGVSPMQGKGYRTSWDSYKGAFRSGYADNEWDDATVGFFSWAGGSNSTAEGLYAFAFGDTNFARSTSSIAFGSGNEVKGAAGFSAGAGNRVCDTYGVAFGNKAQSGGPLINGKCDPDSFNIRGLAAVAIGYNVTADQDHTTAMGKFASNNGFSGTFIWSDGSATASADTFRNTANNEFAARATGGFRFRTNLGGTTGCNLPAGSGVFNCTSSRYTKQNFLAVSGEDVLSRLRVIPVTTWNYISEGQQVRHMGPMAEDFFQAFGLGTGNTSIGVQDLAGVSLAAVKALEQRTTELQQKTVEVDQLRTEVNELRAANKTMEQRLAALEQNAKTEPRARQTAKRRR
ncbi:MAG TPA: tail fiber domain-containing protein [Pyrinomonadaceae bacterium]|jgi:hypothetical protein